MSTGIRRLLIAVSVLICACVAVTSSGLAKRSGGPFYLVPSTTKECEGLKNCIAVTGP